MEPYSLPQLPIEFEPVNHIYTVEGAKLPSVTQIMKPMSMMLYEGIPWDVLSAAADRGTRVHEQVSNFIRFGVLEEDDDTAPYLAAYRAFSEKYKPEWIASEYRVFHKLMRYSGTVDLLGFRRAGRWNRNRCGGHQDHPEIPSRDALHPGFRLRGSGQEPRRQDPRAVRAAVMRRRKVQVRARS